ncbi:NUDIX domain-containing protein [Frigoribacterium sp. PvP032]|uniref:NUDIX hydrolase n=1 Tax=Frigoribacterium sp. PvP032 TaxID=2806589 RepID=UPI001AE39A0F|nr:NUDIX domain-containing protein [Frigoribacterium sp. PvP032]MBP1189138.1 8-oxo-dGTP pyrophosphatase MutT (NUDIX family) [Frigoribacterium sp. PvP032]
MDPIVVSALVLVRDRRLLMVTARGRDVLYLPGGKQETGETGEDALVRETREEVGLELDPTSLRELGSVRTQAHGEPEGREVHMRLWTAAPTDPRAEPTPSGEIGALHWATSGDAHRCPPAGVETLRLAVELDLVD